jgi:hypothetical protein
MTTSKSKRDNNVLRWRDITGPLLAFLSDAEVSEKELKKDDSQFHRRAFVRSLFAMIEGTIHVIKFVSLHAASIRPKMFSLGEFTLLKEQSYSINGKGEAYAQKKFVRTEDNLKFVVRCLNRFVPRQVDLAVGGEDWNNFCEAIKIRNRITHPRAAADLHVSDEETELMKNVQGWFLEIPAVLTSLVPTDADQLATEGITMSVESEKRVVGEGNDS